MTEPQVLIGEFGDLQMEGQGLELEALWFWEPVDVSLHPKRGPDFWVPHEQQADRTHYINQPWPGVRVQFLPACQPPMRYTLSQDSRRFSEG